MTKEEILNKRDLIIYLPKEEEDIVEGDKKYVLESMDEYAEQECIGFTEWAFGDDINPFIFVKGKWMQANGNSTSWSTKELYQLYLKSKQLK